MEVLFFFAKPKVSHNWLNDIDEELINCYRIIKDRPQELIEALKGEVALKERHNSYKHEFVVENDLARAQRWFYLNRTSYSGIMNMKNCYWGYGDKYSMRPENWANNINRTALKLQDLRLTSFDFELLLDGLPEGENLFLFIDPPYFNADQDKFYAHSFCKEDHFRLSDAIARNAHKFNFLMTYDNSQEMWDMYSWATSIFEREWNYTISRTDDQTKKGKTDNLNVKGSRSKGKEIFILNYTSVGQLEIF